MVHIQQTRALCVPTRQHTLGNQAAIGAGKIQRGIVFGKICGGFGRVFRQPCVVKFIHMVAQNMLPQAARTTVYQQLQALRIERGGQAVGRVNGIHRLQLGKMVSAADGTQGSLKRMLRQQLVYPRLPILA